MLAAINPFPFVIFVIGCMTDGLLKPPPFGIRKGIGAGRLLAATVPDRTRFPEDVVIKLLEAVFCRWRPLLFSFVFLLVGLEEVNVFFGEYMTKKNMMIKCLTVNHRFSKLAESKTRKKEKGSC